MSDDEERYIPKAGQGFGVRDFDMLIEAVRKRRENFPDEDPTMTMALVMFNIGDRFAPVTCIEGEWEALKMDLPKGDGVPKCPNGHVCTQGFGLQLGWIQGD